MRKTYLANAAYYTAMPFIRNGLAFVTLPVLTSFLTPADYGIAGLVTIVASLGAFSFCGVGGACYRYYFKYKDDPAGLRLLFSSTLAFVLSAAALYAAALALAFPLLNEWLFKGRLGLGWLLLGFAQVVLNYAAMTNQYVFQNRHEGRRWFLNEAAFTAVYVGLSLGLVMLTPLRYEALVLAGFAGEAARAAFTFAPLRALYAPRFSRAALGEALGYSWPQLPAGLIGFGYAYLDRLIMSRAQGLPQVGVLEMSSRVASTVKMALDGVSGVLSPKTVELLKEGTPEASRRLAEISLKVLAAVLCASLLVILVSKELVLLLLRGDFGAVVYVAPLYIYSHIFGALGMLAYWLIYYHRENTWLQIPILSAGLVTGTTLNLLLIPRYGLMGAAAAMFVTSGIVQTAQFFIGLKCTPVPFDLGRIAGLFGALIAATGMLYVLYWLRLPWAAEAGVKLLLFAAFVRLCFVLGALGREDAAGALALAREKLSGTPVLGRLLSKV